MLWMYAQLCGLWLLLSTGKGLTTSVLYIDRCWVLDSQSSCFNLKLLSSLAEVGLWAWPNPNDISSFWGAWLGHNQPAPGLGMGCPRKPLGRLARLPAQKALVGCFASRIGRAKVTQEKSDATIWDKNAVGTRCICHLQPGLPSDLGCRKTKNIINVCGHTSCRDTACLKRICEVSKIALWGYMHAYERYLYQVVWRIIPSDPNADTVGDTGWRKALRGLCCIMIWMQKHPHRRTKSHVIKIRFAVLVATPLDRVGLQWPKVPLRKQGVWEDREGLKPVTPKITWQFWPLFNTKCLMHAEKGACLGPCTELSAITNRNHMKRWRGTYKGNRTISKERENWAQ